MLDDTLSLKLSSEALDGVVYQTKLLLLLHLRIFGPLPLRDLICRNEATTLDCAHQLCIESYSLSIPTVFAHSSLTVLKSFAMYGDHISARVPPFRHGFNPRSRCRRSRYGTCESRYQCKSGGCVLDLTYSVKHEVRPLVPFRLVSPLTKAIYEDCLISQIIHCSFVTDSFHRIIG